MISRVFAVLRHLRRAFHRSEWIRRILRLPPDASAPPEAAGLLLVQIDGFAKRQLERAIADGRMPFLRRLRDREEYVLHPLYSGIPSTTPAVQGELLYGVRTAVPAFQFRDHESGELTSFLDTVTAKRVERRLAATGDPALAGGSAYSNAYTGGATDAGFCASSLGLSARLRECGPLRLIASLVLYAVLFVRIVLLIGIELALAVYDLVRGAMAGRSFWYEVAFLPKRVAITILLREVVTISGCVDAMRGVPVIHCNYLGYDEQSHRRGPGSRFAHWSLKGTDRCIEALWRAAQLSPERTYDFWVYSDHGQEATAWYHTETGRSLQEAVEAVFRDAGVDLEETGTEASQTQTARAQQRRLLSGDLILNLFRWPSRNETERPVQVAPMGPVAHVYAPVELADAKVERIADDLVRTADVPIVLRVDEHDAVVAHTADGRHALPGDAAALLGPDRTDAGRVGTDLAALARHPDAGDWVLLGWRREGRPLTFAHENGSHGGPGTDETGAFALLPPDAPLDEVAGSLRPLDLHAAILRARGLRDHPAGRPAAQPAAAGRERDTPTSLRVMTYNIHSCRGLDGRTSPGRIARIIARSNPDLVALQEVDVGRQRTDTVDQARTIAHLLEMEYHFHPAIRLEEEQYGDALLGRLPLRLVRSDALPGDGRGEQRGALWVEADADGTPIQVLNTHLGLTARDRARQTEELVGPDWLGAAVERGPVILCGDLNALPRSQVHTAFAHHLRDACTAAPDAGTDRPRTWMGLGRLDHVFVSSELAVQKVVMPRTHLVRVASDHWPLVVDLQVPAALRQHV